MLLLVNRWHRVLWQNYYIRFDLCSYSSSTLKELSILFYGSDEFSLASLRLLKQRFHHSIDEESQKLRITDLEVVTNSPVNSVAHYCRKTNITCHQFDKFKVPEGRYHLGVVSSFGKLIPARSIEACHYGMLNVHGSLLPAWRGASPIQHSILGGDTLTGVTIMRVKPKKFDIGEIVAQRSIEIVHRISAKDLKRMMAPIGAQLLWECIENLEESLAQAKPQPESGVSYAPRIKETDGEINWSTMDAVEVDRRYRALNGFVDTYTHWLDGTVLKLSDTVDPDLVTKLKLSELCGQTQHLPGLVFYHRKRHFLCIASARETWSAFRSLTLKGRKKMSALGFYNTFIRPMIKESKSETGICSYILLLGSPKAQLIDSTNHPTDTRTRLIDAQP